MISPRHLWSGDWRADSAATAEELAARRAGHRPPEPPEPEPPAATKPPAALKPPRRRRRHPRTPSRHLRVALVLAVLALLSAGVAYGLTSAFGTSKSQSTADSQGYLGLQIDPRTLMDGLLIDSVSPGGPAQHAGIRPGDVLSRIGQIQVRTPADVHALMQGRHPGDQVQLSIERGSSAFIVDLTLAARP